MVTPSTSASSGSPGAAVSVISRNACSTQVSRPPFLNRCPLADEIMTGGTPNYGRREGIGIRSGAWPPTFPSGPSRSPRIRDAAGAIYQAGHPHAVDSHRGGAAGADRAVPEARGPAANRLLQDPRRLQRRPSADAGAAAGGRVDGQRRQRGARRGVRRAPGRRALLGDGDGHRARHENPRHRTPRRHDRPRHLRRVLADGSNRAAPIA